MDTKAVSARRDSESLHPHILVLTTLAPSGLVFFFSFYLFVSLDVFQTTYSVPFKRDGFSPTTRIVDASHAHPLYFRAGLRERLSLYCLQECREEVQKGTVQ